MPDGETVLEPEGEPARVVRAGEAFWEPGGDVIHYQNGSNRDDIPVRFTVTMPGDVSSMTGNGSTGPPRRSLPSLRVAC